MEKEVCAGAIGVEAKFMNLATASSAREVIATSRVQGTQEQKPLPTRLVKLNLVHIGSRYTTERRVDGRQGYRPAPRKKELVDIKRGVREDTATSQTMPSITLIRGTATEKELSGDERSAQEKSAAPKKGHSTARSKSRRPRCRSRADRARQRGAGPAAPTAAAAPSFDSDIPDYPGSDSATCSGSAFNGDIFACSGGDNDSDCSDSDDVFNSGRSDCSDGDSDSGCASNSDIYT